MSNHFWKGKSLILRLETTTKNVQFRNKKWFQQELSICTSPLEVRSLIPSVEDKEPNHRKRGVGSTATKGKDCLARPLNAKRHKSGSWRQVVCNLATQRKESRVWSLAARSHELGYWRFNLWMDLENFLTISPNLYWRFFLWLELLKLYYLPSGYFHCEL